MPQVSGHAKGGIPDSTNVHQQNKLRREGSGFDFVFQSLFNRQPGFQKSVHTIIIISLLVLFHERQKDFDPNPPSRS